MSLGHPLLDLVLKARKAVETARHEFENLYAVIDRESTPSKVLSMGQVLTQLSQSLQVLSSSSAAMDDENVRNVLLASKEVFRDGRMREMTCWAMLLEDMSAITQWLKVAKSGTTDALSHTHPVDLRSAQLMDTMLQGYDATVRAMVDLHELQSADYMTRNLQHLSEDFEKMRSYVEENLTPAAAMIRQNVYKELQPLTSVTHYGRDAPAECLSGTRVRILDQLKVWASTETSTLTGFWLMAMAGTGKTTIARSFADKMEDEYCLGASFFIKQSIEATRDPCRIVQTLAFDLASLGDGCKRMDVLWTTLQATPQFRDMSLQKQIRLLIDTPLRAQPPTSPLVVVIDALDEAMRPEVSDLSRGIRYMGIKLVDELMSALSQHSLRLFFTSRNQPDIRQELCRDHCTVLDLHAHHTDDDAGDLRLYYETHLDQLSVRTLSEPRDWRSVIDFRDLLNRTGTLFIYAATILRLVQRTTRNPFKTLQSLLDAQKGIYGSSRGPHPLIDLYQRVLEDAVNDRTGHFQDDVASVVDGILRVVVYTFHPISVRSITNLLELNNIDVENLENDLQGLSPVLLIPERGNIEGIVRPLHESFPEFLRTVKLQRPIKLPLDSGLSHARLTHACMQLVPSIESSHGRNHHRMLECARLLVYTVMRLGNGSSA